MGDMKEVRSEDMDVCFSSKECLTECDLKNNLHQLEARTGSRFFSFVNGPYKQHQFLITCMQKLQKVNSTDATGARGRILKVGPSATTAGIYVSQFLWVLTLCLPFILILLGYQCYLKWAVCCSAVFLSVLLCYHSVIAFIVHHNHKTARHFWFMYKVPVDSYSGKENVIMEVTADGVMSVPLLTVSQKVHLVTHLSQCKDKKGVVMLCTRSFWTRRVLDPLLCVAFLTVITLIALIVTVNLLRQNYNGPHS